MPNSSIELHDSEVENISQEGSTVRISFVEVYIHESEGEPGVDPGTGWLQKAELLLEDASIEGKAPDLPRWLSDGRLTIDEEAYENELPIPLDQHGEVTLVMLFVTGDEVEIRAKRISLTLFGEPKYVEEFTGVK